MSLQNPFDIPPGLDSSVVLNEYIFTNNKGLALLVITVIVAFVIIWDKFLAKPLSRNCDFSFVRRNKFLAKFGSWILVLLVLIGCAVFLALNITDNYNLVSLGGLIAFGLVCILLSNRPGQIKWQVLIVGVEIQFILGVILLKTEFGYKLFKFVSEQVTTFYS